VSGLRQPIETASLRLRKLVPEDAGRLYDVSREDRFRRGLPSQVYDSESEARAVLDRLIAHYGSPGGPRRGPYVLGIELRTDGALVGHVGFSPLGDEVEIGFAIAERCQRRGLASEAVIAASDWALAAFGLDRIVGVTSASNDASRRTLLRAGFSPREERRMTFQGTEQMVGIYALERSGGG
jgi:RimJ/RimL family protein N-acetyltransferase